MVSMTTEPVRTYNKIYDHGLGVVLLTLHAMMYVLSGISMAYGAYVFFTDMSFWRPVLLTILAVSFFLVYCSMHLDIRYESIFLGILST